MLDELYDVLMERKRTMPAGSYTAHLLKEGQDKILGKITEEAAEVIQAADKESDSRLIEESADLLYHLLVLLVSREISLEEIWAELEARR